MGSIVQDNILQHILANDLVSPFQYGFLPRRSTQLLNIMDYSTKSLDMRHGVDVIYLDFQKKFIIVPHKCFYVNYVVSLGVQGQLLKWIEIFLINRLQQVVMNGQLSHIAPVISGVPQGSILGPLLFIMSINDLPSVVSSLIFMSVDDAKIFNVIRSHDDYIALQNDLKALYIWSTTWHLKFNISKCQLLHLGPCHHHGPYFLNHTN